MVDLSIAMLVYQRVPPNHPFIDGIFHELNQPAIGVPPFSWRAWKPKVAPVKLHVFFCFHCTCGGCWNQEVLQAWGLCVIDQPLWFKVCTRTKADTQRHGHQLCIDRLDRPCNFADSSSPEAPPFWLVFINTRVSASLSRTLTSSGMIGNCGFHSHLWQLHQVSYMDI